MQASTDTISSTAPTAPAPTTAFRSFCSSCALLAAVQPLFPTKRITAYQALAKQYFDGRLDAACGERAGIAKKPAPDMLLAIMRQLKAEPASTIYIGDSDTDLDTARNAGIACIGACWGFRGRAFLEAHGAKLLAENVGDIWELIK